MELLERDDVLVDLTGLLRRAAEGRGALVLLGGEAGVGKSSVLRQVGATARESTRVLVGHCDPLSTPRPLGPLLDVAPDLGDRVVGLLEHPGEHARLFAAVLASLRDADRPLLVGIEDAHWADEATLDLLRYLGRRIDDAPVVLIVTYRDDEVGPGHPLRVLLGDLATIPAARRVALAPLSEDAVRRLSGRSRFDGADLHRRTGGNPFFVTEVLAGTDHAIPATVRDAVLSRVARLPPPARAVLDAGAVIGPTVEPWLLAAVAPDADAIDACIAAGMLTADGNSFAFRHELAREAVLGALPTHRRRLLHARVLAALRGAPQGMQDLARLAHHADAAGDRAAVLAYATAAADEAAAMGAHREAAAQFARALLFADGLPDPDRARLVEARSLACYLSDQGEEALAARQQALAFWVRLGNRAKEGETLRWLARLYWARGRGAEAEAAVAAALAALEGLPPGHELAMAYSTLAQLRMLDDDCDAAIAWAERAIALAERCGDTEPLVHALGNIGTARLLAGDERGRADLERSLSLARDAGLVDHAGRALANLAWTALRSYRLDEAEDRLAVGITEVAEHDLDLYHRYLLAGRALVSLHRGAWDDAMSDAHAALRQPEPSPLTRIVALTVLGRLLARRGDPESAALLDEALALAERTGLLQRLHPIRVARAEAALLAGDRAAAAAEAQDVASHARTRGNAWDRGEIALILWRAGREQAPAGDLAEPFALEVAGEWAASAAAWAALGCPYEEARVLAEAGDEDAVRRALAVFERLGARPNLALAMRRLRSLGVRDLPPVRRGPRRSTQANPAGLTRREAEVLDLVAAGLTNAQIADRLYLAPKTVSHHLSAVYAKLGVTTRIEAIRAASQSGMGGR